jgi:hypothetical protein
MATHPCVGKFYIGSRLTVNNAYDGVFQSNERWCSIGCQNLHALGNDTVTDDLATNFDAGIYNVIPCLERSHHQRVWSGESLCTGA